MEKHIKLMNDHLITYENLFYDRIIDMGNSKNSCKCEKRDIYWFGNIGRNLVKLCTECGGYIN